MLGSTGRVSPAKCGEEPSEKGRNRLPRILLTGSSGMLGTRLFEKLLDLGFHTRGIDRKRNRWKTALQARTYIADLLKKDSLNMPSEFDMVVHFAANARVYELVKTPQLALENVLTTFNVLEFARKRDIDRLLFASSREVYGNLPESSPIAEDRASSRNCESPYSASKIAGEALFESYGKVYGLGYVILRYSNVYGMYDDSDRVIPLWVRRALRNEQLLVYGRDKSLDFTYIDDAVNGTIRAIERFNRVKQNVFNIASGKATRLVELAHEIKRRLRASCGIVIEESRPGEVWKFKADISKATQLLRYIPRITMEAGLDRTLVWYKSFYCTKEVSRRRSC